MAETARQDADVAFAGADPARSPLYGIRGLLLLLAGLLALRGLVSCGTLLSALAAAFAAGEGALVRAGLAVLLYLPDLALTVAAFVLLLRRRIVFRVFYTISAAFRMVSAALVAIRALIGGSVVLGVVGCCIVAVLGAGIAYVFCSERVRVTCGLPPRRSQPSVATEAHWSADGTAYTDERGVVTVFAPARKVRAARFPAGHASAKGKRPAATHSKQEGASLQ